MEEKIKKVPKQKIINAAVSLFAQKGYSGTGVREIAKNAGVNISMISYYFEGKIGILQAIMEEFFERYFKVFSIMEDKDKSPEECLRTFVRNLFNFLRENIELSMVADNTIPLELPELEEWKAEKLFQQMKIMGKLTDRFGLDPDDIIEVGTIVPALTSIILSEIRRVGVIKKIWHLKIDEDLIEQYTETLTTFFLYGINGIIQKKGDKNGKNI
jgi:AcrR family transcriptional regulator